MTEKPETERLTEVITMLRAQGKAAKLRQAVALLEMLKARAQSQRERDAKYEMLQAIGHTCASSLAEMVAALECDYDRLKELNTEKNNADVNNLVETDEATELVELREAAGNCTDREDAERRIHEDPLSLQVRSGWHAPGVKSEPEEFEILLSTGGPATRIIGELDEHGEPTKARIQAQDWFQPWTDYRGDAISEDDLLTYCRCFYFGE